MTTNLDIGRITDQINLFWERWSTAVIVAAVGILLLLAVIAVQQWRRRDFSSKASIGFAVVQAGVTWAVVLGVFEFFGNVLRLPTGEAVVLAVFMEAAVWAAVGFIAAHAKTGKTGFGPAGPFFWVAVLGGGTLAILGSHSIQVAIGRSVIVILGAYMWHLRLVQIVHRPAQVRWVWVWTPTRVLRALGLLTPATDDAVTEDDSPREAQIRRIARLIRWSNSMPPWRWLGRWLLTRRAESTTEDVIAEARRRFAAAYVLRAQTRVDSPVMARVITAVQQSELTRQAADSPRGGSPDESPTLYVPDSWVRQGGESSSDSPGDSSGESLVPRQASQHLSRAVTRRGDAGRGSGGAAAGDTPAGSPVPDELIHRATAAADDPETRMAWLWHASGGKASGRQLAKAGGVSASTGIRRRSQWCTTPPEDPRR